MKKSSYGILTALSAVTMLCLVSCSQDKGTDRVAFEWPVSGELVCDVIGKVALGQDNRLFWQDGDQVAVLAAGESAVSSQAVLTINRVDSGLPVAKFKGSVTIPEEPVRCIFAYPAHSSISGNKVVYDYSQQNGTHLPYLYASVPYAEEGIDAVLSHVGGMLRIKVAEGVESLTVIGNQEEKFSKIEYSTDGVVSVTSDAAASIEVAVGSEQVYVAMPPVSFTTGFSVVCHHSDGTKMFRSFSQTGGQWSGYEFQPGTLIDLDLSDYVGFKADCTVSAVHAFDSNNLLRGTDVRMSDFTWQGAPSKIIDQWGVAIYDSKGNFIRWTYGNGAYDGTPQLLDDYTGSWPLLIPNETYVTYAICNVNGYMMQFPSSKTFTVPYPDIKVTSVTGKTSWSYYEAGKVSDANAKDNDAIFEIGASVNVNPTLLTEAYGFKIRFTSDGKDSGFLPMDASPYSSGEFWDGMSWGSHNITAEVSFGGQTYSGTSSIPCYVTGLPYEADWGVSDCLDWNIIGNGVSDSGNCLEFDASGVSILGNAKNGGVVSPAYYLPSSTVVSTSIDAIGKNVDAFGDKTDYLKFYINVGTRSSGVNNSGASVSAHQVSSLGSINQAGMGYVACSSTFTLDSSTPCLVYSTASKTYNKALHKIKIEYAQ